MSGEGGDGGLVASLLVAQGLLFHNTIHPHTHTHTHTTPPPFTLPSLATTKTTTYTLA